MSLQFLKDEVMNGPEVLGGKKLRIAVDFDSTIHNPYDVKKGYKMGVPVEGAQTAIKQLHSEGHYIVIFPTWADNQQRRKAIVDWLTYFDIPFDDITSVKPDADVYLDDRGLRFTSWNKALADIKRLSC